LSKHTVGEMSAKYSHWFPSAQSIQGKRLMINFSEKL